MNSSSTSAPESANAGSAAPSVADPGLRPGLALAVVAVGLVFLSPFAYVVPPKVDLARSESKYGPAEKQEAKVTSEHEVNAKASIPTTGPRGGGRGRSETARFFTRENLGV